MSEHALLPTALVRLTCCKCGVQFGMIEPVYERRVADGAGFHCTSGHLQFFTEPTEKKLRRQVENLQKRLEWADQEKAQQRNRADHEERRARSLKGHATRLRKRVAEGKCPCCSKTFADMAAHIAEQHPRYAAQKDGEP